MLLEKLERTDGTTEMLSECIMQAQMHDKIVAFGAGIGGGGLYDILKKNMLEHKLVAWSDNNSLKFNKTYKEDRLEIIPPYELVEKFGTDICVFVSSSAFDLIKRQLVGYGISEDKIYLFNFAFMDLEYTDYHFIMDHIDDFERAYARMGDEKSKRIFEAILNYRITKNQRFLEILSKDVDDERFQYFDNQLYEFMPNEYFIDIGAYTGDTFEVFNSLYVNGWEKYYGFEADKLIYDKLKTNLSSSKDKCIIFNIAAWNEKTTLYFESNAGSSTMGKTESDEKMSVPADTVDNVLDDKKITLVKMDIEGAEYNALSGMKRLIKMNKPILAVCVYHLRDDYYKLTDFIESTVTHEYKFYFRQYRYTPTETVCYAIPKDRTIYEPQCNQ